MNVVLTPALATDRILRAVTAALEEKRDALDGDAYLEAVRIEIRLIAPSEEPRRGYDRGDVRAVIVQQQSEMRLPPP